MINGVGEAVMSNEEHFLTVWRDANAHYLLGYNEPDPGASGETSQAGAA